MKIIKTIFILALCTAMASCGSGGAKKVKDGEITGKWQPEKLDIEIKGMAKMMADQTDIDEITESLLGEAEKGGWIELKEDGTFTMRDTADSPGWTGTWAYDGEKISMSNDMVKLEFIVESLTKTHMEVDYASMHKAASEGEGVPFFSGMKMIMRYRRIE